MGGGGGGGCSVHGKNIMIHVGNIISALGAFSTLGGHHDSCAGAN